MTLAFTSGPVAIPPVRLIGWFGFSLQQLSLEFQVAFLSGLSAILMGLPAAFQHSKHSKLTSSPTFLSGACFAYHSRRSPSASRWNIFPHFGHRE